MSNISGSSFSYIFTFSKLCDFDTNLQINDCLFSKIIYYFFKDIRF